MDGSPDVHPLQQDGAGARLRCIRSLRCVAGLRKVKRGRVPGAYRGRQLIASRPGPSASLSSHEVAVMHWITELFVACLCVSLGVLALRALARACVLHTLSGVLMLWAAAIFSAAVVWGAIAWLPR
jgi:hypothetical protein